MSFITEDFILQNETAKKLYHTYAKHLPIVDYHCHLDPKEIFEEDEARRAKEFEETADEVAVEEIAEVETEDETETVSDEE